MADLIAIKGIREGLLITLSDAESWDVLSAALLARIDVNPDFFKSARMALAVGGRAINAADLSRLRDHLSERGAMLWAVFSDSPLTMKTAQTLGLAIAMPTTSAEARQVRSPEHKEPEIDSEEPREPAVLVRRTLRSGRSVRHHGHIIILGDVNSGAEIVASGDIIVWGRLRGVAHAGADGELDAVICALDLAPTQLRIANLIATSPERKGDPKPEMARVKDGQIVAERWKQK